MHNRRAELSLHRTLQRRHSVWIFYPRRDTYQLHRSQPIESPDGLGCSANAICTRVDGRGLLFRRRRRHLEHRIFRIRRYGNVCRFCLFERRLRCPWNSVSRGHGKRGLQVYECHQLLPDILSTIGWPSHVECGPYRSWNFATICNGQHSLCLDRRLLRWVEYEPRRLRDHGWRDFLDENHGS